MLLSKRLRDGTTAARPRARKKNRENQGTDSKLKRCGPEQQSVSGLLSLLSRQNRSSRQDWEGSQSNDSGSVSSQMKSRGSRCRIRTADAKARKKNERAGVVGAGTGSQRSSIREGG